MLLISIELKLIVKMMFTSLRILVLISRIYHASILDFSSPCCCQLRPLNQHSTAVADHDWISGIKLGPCFFWHGDLPFSNLTMEHHPFLDSLIYFWADGELTRVSSLPE